ncbi:MAG: hypothetical protein QS748_00175 [Candidatus Endonucleobacter bathymodioli]|uniref:Uncharacterized protein n=1 Tax=Candidatus Endonucleibacter bathymodioli TaxID=539814 RepID=A0AA90SRW7_9GAMM|nr:hypothetical protein [Candidatus Endonucleobacter bathymodioli]
MRGSEKNVCPWEGDTVYGQDGYLVTLTERVSKFLLTVRVKNKTKTAMTGHQKYAEAL